MTSKDRKPAEAASTPSRGSGGSSGGGKRTGEADVGNARRSAYQETIEEQIPDDLLDLLGKLS